ncbi:MAG: ferrochelatase [Thermodesulfobacteriota bacterium]
MSGKKKKGFILLAFGGADSLESVEPFVKNIMKGRGASPELVQKAVERYRLIGGKSPLLDITQAQAEAIKKILASQGLEYEAYVGMRYWHPFIKDTLAKMKADGIDEAVGVIMAPFTSRVATGGYETDIEQWKRSPEGGTPAVFIAKNWHISDLFIEAVIGNVNAELEKFEDKDDVLVIFSSHSLPWVSLEGDPYEMLVNQTVDEIVKRMCPPHYKVAYQSKGSGPREWLGPSTEEVIKAAAKEGRKGVLVVPLGFVADHVETLYDIDILFKGIAESSGLEFRRSASLNTNPKLMELMAELIRKLGERGQ